MSQVVDRVRENWPQYKEVPDDELVEAIGTGFPVYLQDPEFKAQWESVQRRKTERPGPVLGGAGTASMQPMVPGFQPHEPKPEPIPFDPTMAPAAHPVAAYEQFRQRWEREGGRVLEDTDPQVPKLSSDQILQAFPGTPPWLAKGSAASQRAVAGMVDFFLTPVGLATLGLGAVPSTIQKAVAGAFAIDMAREVPHVVEEFGKAAGEGDWEKALEMAETGIGLAYFSKRAGEHALSTKPPGGGGSGPGGKWTGKDMARLVDQMVKRADTGQALKRILETQDLLRQPSLERFEQLPPPRYPAGEALETGVAALERGRRLVAEAKERPLPERPAEPTVEKAPGQETITGRDEGKASVMPAERGEGPRPPGAITPPPEPPPAPAPAPSAPRPARRSRTVDDRPFDVLDAIEGMVGKIRSKNAMREGEEGYYGEVYRNLRNRGALRRLFSSKGDAQGWDAVLDTLRRERILPENATVDDLQAAMEKAADTRIAHRKGQTAEARELDTLAAQQTDFDRLAREGKGKKQEPIAVQELYIGDEFTLDGVKVRVADQRVHPETGELMELVLEDGRRFGVQRVGPDEILQVDKGSYRQETAAETMWRAEHEGQPPPKPPAEPPPPPERPVPPVQQPPPAEPPMPLDRAAVERELNKLREKPKRTARDELRIRELQSQLGQQDLLQVQPPKTIEQVEAEKRLAEQKAEIARRQAERLVGQYQNKQDLSGKFEDPLFGGWPKNAAMGEFQVGASRESAPGPREIRNSGIVVGTHEIRLGGMEHIHPVPYPELVWIVKAISGQVPKIKKSIRAAHGMASGAFFPGKGEIQLRADLFRDVDQASKVLAHELGHLTDWLPDRALDRGNLLGRLATLKQYLLSTIPLDPGSFVEPISPKERGAIRRKAEREVGPRPKDRGERRDWSAKVSAVYQDLLLAEIHKRGLVSEKEVRRELIDLSAYWRPWDRDQADTGFRAYRDSGKELYADAISVLYNSPGLLKRRAPTFWNAFWRRIDAKPEVKQAMLEIQQILNEGHASVVRRRIEQTRAGHMRAEDLFMERWNAEHTSRGYFHNFYIKFKQQWFDHGDAISRAVKELERRGVPEAMNMRHVWEESLYSENLNFRDLRRLHDTVIRPVEAAGMDINDVGLVMQFQRSIGNPRVLEQIEATKAALGGEFGATEAAARTYNDLVRKGIAPERAIQQAMGVSELDIDSVLGLADLLVRQGSRVETANPQGLQKMYAEETLVQFLKDKGPEKAKLLLDAAAKFRELFYERFLEGHQVGIFSDRMAQIAAWNKDNYAAFRSIEHVDTYVTPIAKAIHGTHAEIENPFFTTTLKLLGLNNLISLQKAKIAVRDVFLEHFPESWKPADKYWHDGWRYRPPAKGLERLTMMENGRVAAYDVDPFLADAFKKLPTSQINTLTGGIDFLFRSGIYPLIITYNPGFQYWRNPMRDFRRAARNIGAIAGVNRLEYLRHYKESWGDAKSWATGAPNALVQEMMEAGAMGTPIDTLTRMNESGALDVVRGSEPMRVLLERSKVIPKTVGSENALIRGSLALPRHIEKAGVTREAMPKIAAWRALVKERGMDPRKAADIIRNYIGTPNFRVKGAHINVPQALGPFLNMFIQGYRADFRLMTSPKTAGGWWLRWWLHDGSKAVLVGLASAGVLGEALRELYGQVGEYDKSNYDVLPLGRQEGGDFGFKVPILRFAKDETSRPLSAAVYKLTRLLAGDKEARKFPSEVFDVGAGVFPTVSPIIKVWNGWWDYAAGRQVPVDPWTGRPIMPDPEWRVGGWHSLKPMLGWTIKQSGLVNLFSYNPDSDSTAEWIISATPGLKSAVKFTDQGAREQQREAILADQRWADLVRVQYNAETRSLLNEYASLRRAGLEHRSPAQQQRYAELVIWKTNFDRLDDMAQSALEMDKKELSTQLIKQADTLSSAFLKNKKPALP